MFVRIRNLREDNDKTQKKSQNIFSAINHYIQNMKEVKEMSPLE